MAGDVFLLGTHSWRIRRVEPGRVRVEDAHGAAPSIPFWRGEAPAALRSFRARSRDLREDVADVATVPPECGLDRAGAEQAVEYVQAGRGGAGRDADDRRRCRGALLR